jgi:RNA polymerase sigma factor (sigma-70 family)
MHDRQLLRHYIDHGSEAAFAALVERHLRLVYATCLRDVRHPQLAEDVTQAVFLILARKARTIRTDASLAGWLFSTARFVSKNALKQEAWRAARERKAADMQAATSDADSWREIDPVLNDALASLRAPEREVILLRFFQELSFAETGVALGISEDAAKMRVGRAVDKLRRCLTKAGVAVPAAGLAGLLAENAATAVPTISVASIVAGAGAACLAGITVIMEGAMKAMKMAKMKTAVAAMVVALGIVGGAAGLLAHSNGAATASATGATQAQSGSEWRKTADPEALRLLDQMSATYRALSSFSAIVETDVNIPMASKDEVVTRSLVAFKRPDKLAIKPIRDTGRAAKIPDIAVKQFVYDGKFVYRESRPGAGEYGKDNMPDRPLKEAFNDSTAASALLPHLIAGEDVIAASLGLNNPKSNASLTSLTLNKPATVDGDPVDIITAVMTASDHGMTMAATLEIAIDRSHRLRRATMSYKDGAGHFMGEQSETHSNVKLNPDVPASVFVYDAMPGDKLIDQSDTRPHAKWSDVPVGPDQPNRAGTAVLIGKVVAEDGTPLAGVKVKAELSDNAENELRGAPGNRMPERLASMGGGEALSGQDGSYRITGLTDLPYDLLATDPSLERVAPPAMRVIGREGRTVSASDFVMTAGAVVMGTVTDKDSGHPIKDASIDCLSVQWPKFHRTLCSTKSDAAGKFRLHVVPGRIFVICSSGENAAAEQRPITVAAGEATTLNFAVEPRGKF